MKDIRRIYYTRLWKISLIDLAAVQTPELYAAAPAAIAALLPATSDHTERRQRRWMTDGSDLGGENDIICCGNDKILDNDLDGGSDINEGVENDTVDCKSYKWHCFQFMELTWIDVSGLYLIDVGNIKIGINRLQK